MRTILYGKKAANLYTQAFVQNTQARALYQESEDTVSLPAAVSLDDLRCLLLLVVHPNSHSPPSLPHSVLPRQRRRVVRRLAPCPPPVGLLLQQALNMLTVDTVHGASAEQ